MKKLSYITKSILTLNSFTQLIGGEFTFGYITTNFNTDRLNL